MRAVTGILAGLIALAAPLAAQAQSGAPVTIHYADTSNSPIYSQYYVAQAKGFFANHNVEVVPVSVSPGAAVLAAMARGDIDVGGIAPAQAILAQQSGADIKIIASGEYPITYTALVRTGVTIKSLKDVKGMKLANVGPGTGIDALDRYLLTQAGIDPNKDVTMVNLGVQPGAWLSAFQNKQVDMAPAAVEPWISLIEDSKVGYEFQDWEKTGLPGLPNNINTAFLGAGRWVKDHPDAAKAFVQSIADADVYMNNPANLAEAVTIVSKALGGNPKIIHRAIEGIGKGWSPVVSRGNIADTVAFMKGSSMISQSTDVSYEKLVAVGIAPDK